MILPKESKIVETFSQYSKIDLLTSKEKNGTILENYFQKCSTLTLSQGLSLEMIEISDYIFEDFEKNMEVSETKVSLSAMMLNFTFSVVVSGFLGLDPIKDKYKY